MTWGQLGELALRARRPALYGDRHVLLDVHELWLPRSDPDGLRLEAEGCYHARELLECSDRWRASRGC